LGVRHQLVLWLVERIGANGRDAPPAVQDRVEGARSNSSAACPRAGWNSASNCSHSAGANSASAARIDGPVRSIFVVVTVTRRISANAVPWAGRAGSGPGAPAWHRSDRSQPSRNPIPAQRSMPPGFRPPGFRPPGTVPVGHRPLPHRPQPHHGQLHHPAPVRPASPGPSGSATPSSSWVTRHHHDPARGHRRRQLPHRHPKRDTDVVSPKYLDTAAWAPGSPLTGRG